MSNVGSSQAGHKVRRMVDRREKLKKEDLKQYQIAQQLRSAANRCTRMNADVAMLCEHALAAASWLENEAEDVSKLTGSVTHNALMGRITPGCIIHETPNVEFSGC